MKYVDIILVMCIVIASMLISIAPKNHISSEDVVETENVLNQEDSIYLLEDLLKEYFVNESSNVDESVDGDIIVSYNIRVIMSKCMYAHLDNNGVLHVYLDLGKCPVRDEKGFELYIDSDFGPKTVVVNGSIIYSRKLEIYTLDLSNIYAGRKYELYIFSSKEYIVMSNITVYSLEDEKKLVSMTDRIRAPVVSSSCKKLSNNSYPYVCNITIPEYFIWLTFSKKIDYSGVYKDIVINAPRFLKIEFVYNMDDLLSKFDDEETREDLIDMIGGLDKKFIVVLVYIVNNGTENMTIMDYRSHTVFIKHIDSGKSDSCSVMAEIIKPNKVIIPAKSKKLFYIVFLIKEDDGYYLKYECWHRKKLEPGRNIISITFYTQPEIRFSILVNIPNE